MNRRYLAIAFGGLAIVLLIVAAFRLAISLRSSVEIDEITQNDLAAIPHRFVVDPVAAIIGLIGLAMFWGSFVVRPNKKEDAERSDEVERL